MTFFTKCIITGLLGMTLCTEWTFQQWKDFTTSSNKSSSLYINSREQIIKCCGVCANVPECLTVVLNSDNCICNSEVIPHESRVDDNTSVYVKRPKSCSAPGYIFINTMCIKVSTDNKTWHEAKLDCENSGGILIILDSLEKHQRVFDMLTQYFDNTDMHYFVGASDIEQEGNWKWIKETSFTYFYNGTFNDNDNDFDGQGADCGTFQFKKNKIVDEFCDAVKYYICEVMLK